MKHYVKCHPESGADPYWVGPFSTKKQCHEMLVFVAERFPEDVQYKIVTGEPLPATRVVTPVQAIARLNEGEFDQVQLAIQIANIEMEKDYARWEKLQDEFPRLKIEGEVLDSHHYVTARRLMLEMGRLLEWSLNFGPNKD